MTEKKKKKKKKRAPQIDDGRIYRLDRGCTRGSASAATETD